MEDQIKYETQTYYAQKGFLVAAPIFTILVVIVLGLGRTLHNPAIGVIGWVLVCTVPFFFRSNFINSLSKKAILTFANDRFVISESSLRDEEIKTDHEYCWDEIRAFKVYLGAQTTFLTLYLTDGSRKTFPFQEKKTEEEIIKGTSVLSLFLQFVKNANTLRNEDDKIKLEAGFLTTRSGGVILVSVSIITIFAFILHLYLKPKTSFATLVMGITILLSLIGKRYGDRRFYNRILSLADNS